MNYLLYLFVVLTIVGLDQYTKILVNTFIESKEIPVIDGFFTLINTKNYGAGFSILQNQRILLIAVPIVVVIIIAIYLLKHKDLSKIEITSLLFITGGAIGNLIDRAFKGYVVDFLDFNFFGYHYPTFNVADSFVTVGAIILIIYLLFIERKHGKDKNNS